MRQYIYMVVGFVTVGKLVACGAEGLDEEGLADDGRGGVASVSQALGGPYFDQSITGYVLIAPGEKKQFHAYCPSGGVSVGGGMRGSDGLRLLGSYRSGTNRWSVIVKNTGGSTNAVKTYVNCLMDGDDATVTVVDPVSQLVAPGSFGSKNAHCDNPAVLVGGGFAVWGDAEDVYPRFSKPGSNSYWTAGLQNYDTENAYIWAEAICLEGIDFSWTQASKTTIVHANSWGSIWNLCSSGYSTSNGFDYGQQMRQTSGKRLSVYLHHGTTDGFWGTRVRNHESGSLSLESHSLCIDLNPGQGSGGTGSGGWSTGGTDW